MSKDLLGGFQLKLISNLDSVLYSLIISLLWCIRVMESGMCV
jgi:hypothetical protein